MRDLEVSGFLQSQIIMVSLPGEHSDDSPCVSRNDARGSKGWLWNLMKNITDTANLVEHAKVFENNDGISIRQYKQIN